MDFGFATYALAIPEPEEIVPTVPVVLGEVGAVVPVLQDSAPILIEKGLKSAITTHMEVAEAVKAPVEAGQRLGTLTLQANGQPLAAIALVAPEAIAKLSWLQITKQLLSRLCFSAPA